MQRLYPLVIAREGKLWAIGGVDDDGNDLSCIEVYNSESDSWSDGPPAMNSISGEVVGCAIPDEILQLWTSSSIGGSDAVPVARKKRKTRR